MKPENVLLDANMRVKITDFGTAKILTDPNSGMFSNPRKGVFLSLNYVSCYCFCALVLG